MGNGQVAECNTGTPTDEEPLCRNTAVYCILLLLWLWVMSDDNEDDDDDDDYYYYYYYNVLFFRASHPSWTNLQT